MRTTTEPACSTHTVLATTQKAATLNLQRLYLLLIGGEAEAAKALTLLHEQAPDAHVTVVAASLSKDVQELVPLLPNGQLRRHNFVETDLEAYHAAIVATDDRVLNKALADLCRSRRLLVYEANKPESSDFALTGAAPAVPKTRKVRSTREPKWMQALSRNKGFSIKNVLLFAFAAIGLMVTGHLLFTHIPLQTIGNAALDVASQVDADILIFILAGFVAQLIDGALGMAYGVSATTFLLSFGVSPVAASASVHASEIFTSGVSGWMHLKFGNVNSKLFRNIVLPGVLGAILGAYLLYSFEEYLYIIKPIVAVYTLVLGVLIIRKVLRKKVRKQPVKRLGFLATAGGFLDAIGGGGWGPIVSSTLIAKGRNPMYTIGSVNLAEFFVSIASSATFITFAGISHWQVIVGLILGGSISAPIGAMLARRLPIKTMMLIVGIVVIIVSLRLICMAVL